MRAYYSSFSLKGLELTCDTGLEEVAHRKDDFLVPRKKKLEARREETEGRKKTE